MCTLTVVTGNDTYRVAMNRDEKIARGAGLPPEIHESRGIQALYPSDGNGGAWFGTNEFGITLALLNWNRVATDGVAVVQTRGRGEAIPALIHSRSLAHLHRLLSVSDFRGMMPFRLIGVFPSEHEIREWLWDATQLACVIHPWGLQHWFSSSLSDQLAESLRGSACRNAADHSDVGSVPWLQRLHASHAGNAGPFSLCVHREDVKTLSYSEVEVTLRHVRMSHFRGSPCTMGSIQQIAIERALAENLQSISAFR